MKVYICHYYKLKNRLEYLIPELEKNGFTDIEVEYGIGRDDISIDELSKFTNDVKHISERRFYGYNFSYDILISSERGVIANFLTHISIWEKIAYGNEEWSLVLEDDARLDKNFNEYWDMLISSMPSDMDIAYLHDGCGYTVENKLGIKTNPDVLWYPCVARETRTCCSYLISKTTCQKFLKDLYPIALPVDHELNYIQKKYRSQVYWCSPVILHEGSGRFYSSNLR